jgi:hypothetical protein
MPKLAVAALLAAVPTASLAQAPKVHEVSMVRQDTSDCLNANVTDQDVSRINGTVIVVRNGDGTSSVKVAITAAPNTKYNFYLKCIRGLGQIETYDEGEGAAEFKFNTNETGNNFGFDMYPDGAPAGNKFQSVQVQF